MTNRIAVVGATGLVGTTILSLLDEKKFPVDELYLVASYHSAGKEIVFKGKKLLVHDLASFDFSLTNLAFFCVSQQLAAEYAPKAVHCGNVVIDKSFQFRNDPKVPLVIPEVNLNALTNYPMPGLIANPNCNTIPIAVALKPIYDAVGINRINVATYQSVSGTGKEAVQELQEQTEQFVAREMLKAKVYPQQIAFNVLPHVDAFQENGYTLEEMKIVWEIRKIFDDPLLAINPTAVRVPVFCGHSAAVHLETKQKISVAEAKQLLQNAPGVKVSDGALPYATPASDAAGKDEVYVGRIREDISSRTGLNLWVVADNLRKGAALNAIQIANHLLKN